MQQTLERQVIPFSLEALQKLSKDVKQTATNLGRAEARFLVDLYYQLQEFRIRTQSQCRSITQSDVDEPINPNDWGEINNNIIDETTICQPTGRKDANGTDIWEHDKVHVWYTNGFEDYDEEMTVARTKVGFAPFDWEYECDGCDLRCEITKIEITGNEFDEEV